MDVSSVCPGRLVRCNLEGPGFRRGALFQILPAVDGVPMSSFIGCRAVGSARLKVWYFRPQELSIASWDESFEGKRSR